jgi:RNA polymerase sigma factor (sigma-70 family)
MLHHQDPEYLQRLGEDRRNEAARRRQPAGAGEIERVVLAAAAHNSSAWGTLVERFGSLVKGVARRHGLGSHDVEDVEQMTWMRLFESIDDVREAEAIGGWLATTARRESLKVLHRGKREIPSDGEFVVSDQVEPINERRLVAAEQRSALQASVQQLPQSQRELIAVLLCDPPPNYAQISRSLGIAQGSIGPTRQRGLARLREDKTLLALYEDELACVGSC